MIKEGEGVDLCCDDPGKDVDVYITADLRAMVEVHMEDRTLREARESGKVPVQRPPTLLKNFSAWYGLNVFSGIRPAELKSA